MTKPNLIYIFCDQFRRQAVGYMGEDPVVTPHLDKFAREGIVFNQAISNYPVCSPYRGMLLTGLYPHKNHIFTNCHSESALQGCYLHEDQVCLSDILGKNGYELGYIGKWHLDAPTQEQSYYTEGKRKDGLIWDAYTPPGKRRHGFSFWYSYGCADNHMNPHYWINDAKIEERLDVCEWSVAHETQVAIEYIKNHEKPFALFISFNPPHTDFSSFPQKYLNYYKGKTEKDLLVRANVKNCSQAVKHVKNYFATITGIDEHFGRIMQAIQEKGIEDNTIIIFTSDHGEMMGSQGLMHKKIWYEEAVGVPFIVRWLGQFKHQDVDAQISTIDIMPTILGLVGLEAVIPKECVGYNFAPSMYNGRYTEAPDSTLYFCNDKQAKGYGRGIRDKRYTFILSEVDGKQQCSFYDRKEDPYQMHNGIKNNRELAQIYLEKLKHRLQEIEDPFEIKIQL